LPQTVLTMRSTIRPWADTPFTLIPTPSHGQDLKTIPDHVYMAREMVFAHNGMLRGLNSIYQQCIHVFQPKDVADLLKYAEFWCDWIHEHHSAEETILFPKIEAIIGQKGFMERNILQHHEFMGDLEGFQKVVKETSVEDYDGMKLRAIIDGFGQKLTEHLTSEIGTLLELDKYPDPGLKQAWLDLDALMRKADASVLHPLVFGTADRTFENEDWPEVPMPVRYLVHYWFERKHRGVWRFSPSTTFGEPRPLTFGGETS